MDIKHNQSIHEEILVQVKTKIKEATVPVRYDGLYGNVSDIVERVAEYYSNDASGERFTTTTNFDGSLFTPDELKTLEMVADSFKNIPTSKIVSVSHEESGWKENQLNRNLISYQYAFDLRALN